MIEVGRISSIWRYPVKSMAGERIPEAAIGEFGLPADRTWAVRDVENRATTGVKKFAGLLMCTARYAQTPPPEAGPGHAPLCDSGRQLRRRLSGTHHHGADWCGCDLHLPHADLQPLIPTIRCVMPSLEQPGIERDPTITRTVAKHSRRRLGVYGAVLRPGRIAEGEVLHLDSQKRGAGGLTKLPGGATIKRMITRAASAALPRGERT